MATIDRTKLLKITLWSGLLIFIVLIAYLPIMDAGFIWDDNSYIANNPQLRTLKGLKRIWFKFGRTPQYYPMVFTTYWIEFHLWNLNPFGYHFVNIFLHALNAVLLWLVLLRLKIPAAWMVAAVFALHPVHVESVAWITERKNVLSGFFFLFSLLTYLHLPLLKEDEKNMTGFSERNPLQAKSRCFGLYTATIALFIFALFSKTITCSLPAVILLLLWWKYGRIGLHNILRLVPMFFLGAAFGLLTAWMEKYHVGAEGIEWSYTFIERCLIAGRALWFYADKLVWPSKLIFIYPQWQIDPAKWWQYLFPLTAIAVVCFLFLLRKRTGRGPLTAVLIFSGTLFPALGFFNVYPMQYSFVADHFQYLASISLIVLFIVTLHSFLKRVFLPQWFERIKWALSIIFLITMGTLVRDTGLKYKNAETLWRDTIKKNPQCTMAYLNLGNILKMKGNLNEAIVYYRQAVKTKPTGTKANTNMGLVLQSQGNLEEAIFHFRQAVVTKPFAPAYYHLGVALQEQGKLDEAIEQFRKAILLKPDAQSYVTLGLALQSQENLDEAIINFRGALQIKPNFARAHYYLGNILLVKKNINGALNHFREALRVKPDFADAQTKLNYVLSLQTK